MDSKILTYRVIIQKDGRSYHGFVPSLPGCHTQGDTIEKTKKNLREAINGYIKSLIRHNEPIPIDEGFESTETIELTNLPRNYKPSYA